MTAATSEMILGFYLSSVLRLLLPSEYRGADLAAAEASLNGQDLPTALVTLGKVLLCAGQIKRARGVLSRPEGLATDPVSVSLAGAYKRLSELADFGACREWAPGRPPELARKWSLSGWAIERNSWARQRRRLPPDVEQEVWFITEIAPFPIELSSASSADEVRPMWARLAKANERLAAEPFRWEVALGTGMVNVMALRLVDRRSEATEFATRGIERCRAAGDRLGQGLFALLANDVATTSRTVPEVIDLYAGDAGDLSRTVMEALEEGPLPAPPPDWGPVFKGQSPARTIFEEVDWPLGIAAAQVQAASWITRAKPADVPASFELQQLVEAQAAFERAGDEAGKRLVQCRLMAAGVEQNAPLEHVLLRAHEIGVWGREVGSASFTLGLGFFLLAVARWWRRRGDLACALRALNLATAIFDGLEAPVAAADAAMEEADLLAGAWESSQAVLPLERALSRYIDATTAMGIPSGGYLGAWQRLRQRIAQASAALLSASTGHESVAHLRQRLIALNILPGMSE